MASAVEYLNQFQENLTKYVGTIDSDHAYIHDGIAFTAIHVASGISAAYDICFKTPNAASGKFVHWRPIGITTSADYCAFQLTEGETYTGGTAIVPINRNRALSALDGYATKMQAFVYNATCTPGGTVIQAGGVGTSGIATAKGGGGSSADQELVLKADTIYCLTLTPDGATDVTVELFWYEENKGYDEE
jgi:hypothetical protein